VRLIFGVGVGRSGLELGPVRSGPGKSSVRSGPFRSGPNVYISMNIHPIRCRNVILYFGQIVDGKQCRHNISYGLSMLALSL